MSINCLNQKGFAPILILIGLVIFGGAVGGAYYLGTRQASNIPPSVNTTPSQKPSITEITDSVQPSSSQTPQNSLPTVIPSVAKQNPSPSVESITSLIKNIPVVSTQDWKEVTYKGISFKIPSKNYFMESQSGSEGLIMDEQNTYSVFTIVVADYKGGSRREQYYKMYPYAREANCHEIFQEVQFGNVKALEIAIDGGWCQGGGGATLAVVGNKFVVIPNLSYDTDTKIIRSETKSALISTLKPN